MTNKWLEHLKKYHASHPNLSYKEAMIEAKKTYKSSGSKTSKPMKKKGGKLTSTPKSIQSGGNPAVLAVAGQALGVGNNLISSISKGVTDRMDRNGFYNRERLRNDRKQLEKLIMDLYVEQHRLGRKNYTREDAEVEARRLAKQAGMLV